MRPMKCNNNNWLNKISQADRTKNIRNAIAISCRYQRRVKPTQTTFAEAFFILRERGTVKKPVAKGHEILGHSTPIRDGLDVSFWACRSHYHLGDTMARSEIKRVVYAQTLSS
jgi:hypothetical protein